MRSRMSPHHYLSGEVFARERAKLFRKLWIFAGLRTMLDRHNDFITRDVAGVPVVVQNFNGDLRAFENLCLHRGARLQWEPAGRRPLLCRYHGWGYNVAGAPENIPLHDELYRFAPAERDGLRLRRYALTVVGNLVFINLDPNPMSFDAQFTPEFIASMASSSNAYDSEVMMTTFRGRFNWKLAYENLRDANHPRFVHAQSLAKNVEFAARVDPVLDAAVCDSAGAQPPAGRDATLRRFSFGGPEAALGKNIAYRWRENVRRWGVDDAYFNWLAYPNLHIASSDGGHSFTIEHHVPVSPDRTDIEIYWMTAKKKQDYASSSAVLASLMHGSKRVVGEDVQVMEAVQAGLHPDAPAGTQGAYESLNRLVERWYTALVDGDA